MKQHPIHSVNNVTWDPVTCSLHCNCNSPDGHRNDEIIHLLESQPSHPPFPQLLVFLPFPQFPQIQSCFSAQLKREINLTLHWDDWVCITLIRGQFFSNFKHFNLLNKALTSLLISTMVQDGWIQSPIL